MKLPKCPHCEKLLLSRMIREELVALGYDATQIDAYQTGVIYYCPETFKPTKPDWVEVLEV